MAIVGAGPAGLAAAVACRQNDLSCVLTDRRGLAQSFVEYPSALRFFSPPDEMELGGLPLPVAGGERPTREQYLPYLRGVVRHWGLDLSTWESVVECTETDDRRYRLTTRFEPDTGTGRTITCRAILLATGVWNEPLKLGCPGDGGANVFSEFHDPTPFTDQEVLVVGSGNSGVGAALSLAEAGAGVHLATRRPPKPGRSGLIAYMHRFLGFEIDEGTITPHSGTIVTKVTPFEVTLQPVTYTGADDMSEGTMEDYIREGEAYTLPVRFVFALLGHRPDRAFLSGVMGLELARDGRPVCDVSTWETPRRNIYVVGSLADQTIDLVLKLRDQATEVVQRIADGS